MCGIYFTLSSSYPIYPSDGILAHLKKRGPDSLERVSSVISPETEGGQRTWWLTAVSSVLSIRGASVVNQPITDPLGLSESFLSWNGEAWRFDGKQLEIHDTDFVYRQLRAAAELPRDHRQPDSSCPAPATQAILNVLSKISGPYAFIFYDSVNRLVFYGRDVLGRRSLLIRWSSCHAIEISSVCGEHFNDGWVEVDAGGIYVLDLASKITCDESASPSGQKEETPPSLFIPWQVVGQLSHGSYFLLSPFPSFNKEPPDHRQIMSATSPKTAHICERLRTSLALRLAPTPMSGNHQRSRVAILFSGGLDCTLIARLASDILPDEKEIDLLNVAFENPRVVEATVRAKGEGHSLTSAFEICPDRVTGRASYSELVRLCPRRTWRFVSIDIPYAETRLHRPEIIALLHPHGTEMDFSIGCALYFAARGYGSTKDSISEAEVPYRTPARILLSGVGADELFGGYTRHATAFKRRGHTGLVEELKLDFERLNKRNLGRDDRIISHWGKEVRYPFLDEDLVAWALQAPVWEKCSFGENVDRQSNIEPSKSVLRHLAWELGLRVAAMEKKRAIQFGARTAKMESGKTRGSQTLD